MSQECKELQYIYQRIVKKCVQCTNTLITQPMNIVIQNIIWSIFSVLSFCQIKLIWVFGLCSIKFKDYKII